MVSVILGAYFTVFPRNPLLFERSIPKITKLFALVLFTEPRVFLAMLALSVCGASALFTWNVLTTRSPTFLVLSLFQLSPFLSVLTPYSWSAGFVGVAFCATGCLTPLIFFEAAVAPPPKGHIAIRLFVLGHAAIYVTTVLGMAGMLATVGV